jgi:hypothetical protein
MTQLNRKIHHRKHAITVVMGNPLRAILRFPPVFEKNDGPTLDETREQDLFASTGRELEI